MNFPENNSSKRRKILSTSTHTLFTTLLVDTPGAGKPRFTRAHRNHERDRSGDGPSPNLRTCSVETDCPLSYAAVHRNLGLDVPASRYSGCDNYPGHERAKTNARMACSLPIVDLRVPAMPLIMTSSTTNTPQRKPLSGQPNILKLGLTVTAIHVLFLLLVLGKIL